MISGKNKLCRPLPILALAVVGACVASLVVPNIGMAQEQAPQQAQQQAQQQDQTQDQTQEQAQEQAQEQTEDDVIINDIDVDKLEAAIEKALNAEDFDAAIQKVLAQAARAQAAQEVAVQVEEVTEELAQEAGEDAGEEAGDTPRRPRRSARMASMTELPMGHVGEGANAGGRAASYRFTAQGPGLLTVAVRAKTEADLSIDIKNSQGRTLPNGQCDIDFNNNQGAEHLAVSITEAGDYEVAIDPLGSGGQFWISASWLSIDSLAQLTPRKPAKIVALKPGDSTEGEVKGDYMSVAWYSFTAPSDGLLVFDAIGRNGDLVLEIYTDEDFFEPDDRIDGDRRGNAANEMLSADLSKGDELYIKVASQSSSGTKFRARARFVPNELPQEEGADE